MGLDSDSDMFRDSEIRSRRIDLSLMECLAGMGPDTVLDTIRKIKNDIGIIITYGTSKIGNGYNFDNMSVK